MHFHSLLDGLNEGELLLCLSVLIIPLEEARMFINPIP